MPEKKGQAVFEKRRYERVSWFCSVDLKVLPNGPVVSGTTFDVSIGGVGIAANRILERGKLVSVQFHMHDNRDHHPIEENVMGKVAYGRADEDGGRIGIEFMEVVSKTKNPELAKKIEHLSSVAC